MSDGTEKQSGESKIRKVLFNEVSIGVAIIMTVFSAFNYVTDPARKNAQAILDVKTQLEGHEKLTAQIQNIKDNDLHTIETQVMEVKKDQQALKEDVIKLQTIIEERIPKK